MCWTTSSSHNAVIFVKVRIVCRAEIEQACFYKQLVVCSIPGASVAAAYRHCGWGWGGGGKSVTRCCALRCVALGATLKCYRLTLRWCKLLCVALRWAQHSEPPWTGCRAPRNVPSFLQPVPLAERVFECRQIIVAEKAEYARGAMRRTARVRAWKLLNEHLHTCVLSM